MPNLKLKYDDLDLTEIVATIEGASPMRINAQSIPKRHGALVSEVPVLDPRRVVFRGRLQEVDAITLRGTIDTIQKTLRRFNKRLTIWDDRYLNSYCINFQYNFIPGSAMAACDFVMDFFCADPFFYANDPETQTITVSSADVLDVTTGVYEKIANVDNQGSCYVFPKITVTNTGAFSITKIVINNATTARSWDYSGTLAAGKELVVDSAEFTVTNDGASALTGWSGSFLWLDPGINSLEVGISTTAPVSTISCVVKWNRRWY